MIFNTNYDNLIHDIENSLKLNNFCIITLTIEKIIKHKRLK